MARNHGRRIKLNFKRLKRKKMKQVTVFAVATFGGQIIDFQEPIKKKINMNEEQAAHFAKNGFTWDKYANYYKTMKRAKAAINWALGN